MPVQAQFAQFSQGGPPANVRAQMEAAKRAQSQPSNDDKKNKDAKKDDDSKDEKTDEGDKKKEDDKANGPVERPNEPPKPPDPRELKAEPDTNGRVTFSFNGQAWADVLQWLANVSDLSLDWRELPGDYLNLTTQRSYTLVEARDLINRHLQVRGYTLLLSGEVLSVFKLDGLDPSLVPRVTEEELYDRQPHDVVKLSLATPPGLDPKQAVEDVKQALSPNAKVLPLAATKRLLLIDTVANLRMVSALLNEERVAAEGRTVPREFVLKYVQAPAVIDMLYVVLGMDPNSRPSQMELRMQQQKLELMSQMAQRGKDVMKLMNKDGPKVYLVYNRQRNSVLVNAPPEQMEVIQRTIEALDVPTGGEDAFAGATERNLEQYRLKTIAPNAVITTLKEIGNLSPRAELRGDTDSKTLFARGTDEDHEKIVRLIKQLDGAETVVEVFWLRRLPAEAVAGSIESLIINKPKKKKKNNDYPFYFSFRRNDDSDDEPETLLRVDADIENNRLIVRGTPLQLEEVRDLLVKLGEPVGERGDDRRVRTLETLGKEETAALLKKLQAAWPTVGGETELVLPPQQDLPSTEEGNDSEPQKAASDITASSAPVGSPFRLLAAPVAETSSAEKTPPPVSVQIGSAGQIVVSSDDTAALDRFEELAAELAPPPERYKVFRVRNRSPDVIVDNLKIYFKEFLAAEDEQVLDWWGRVRGVKSDEPEPVRLSKRKPLRFLSDDWSSTILVANATPAQAAEISRLIDAWDRTPIDDRILTRRTATVKLRYAKASGVVSALKEVYRDLLSKGDREFDTAEQKASGISTRYLTTIRYGAGGQQSTEPAFIGFDGLLSLGADDSANVVVISAREEVYESVLETINALDEEARPQTTVRVRPIEGGVAMDEVRRALLRALATQDSGNRSSDRSESRSNDDQRRSSRRRR